MCNTYTRIYIYEWGYDALARWFKTRTCDILRVVLEIQNCRKNGGEENVIELKFAAGEVSGIDSGGFA